ncbi:MAG: bifunctional glycoside hydrolase 114/ polysaccharide deacetylase family protein [Burkholderiales bacterium]|nr:bifunctional glycoside hydrolase 114/ polysaccharide deacetylase family protein [Burkholderiales bacterium]
MTPTSVRLPLSAALRTACRAALALAATCVAGAIPAQPHDNPSARIEPATAARIVVPDRNRAQDTPTGLPYGDARARGDAPADPEVLAAPPVPIGAPGWSIALHYGAVPPLDDLRAFDVVVVDPDHRNDPSVHRTRAGGRSELFAYVSVGEIHPSREYVAQAPAGLLVADNAAWGSRVVDQAHPAWPEFLVERIVAPLWAAGYRGFFLDTMDSWQLAARDDAAREAQQAGLARAIEALANRFPEARLIANRGFEVLPRIAPRLSAVAAESLYRGWRQGTRRYEEVPPADREWLLARLAEVRDRYRLPTIAIDYLPPGDREAMRETARRIGAHGVVPYVADPALETVGIGAIEVVPRRILVLHDQSPEADPAASDVHRFLSMPLQWLGYRVELWNVRQRPPPAGTLADRYAGVVAWFNGNTAGRGWDLPGWVRGVREQGLRIAFVNGFGATLQAGGLGTTLGLVPFSGRVEAPLEIRARDPIVGHELQPTPTRNELQPLTARGVVRPLVRVADARGTVFDVAAITDWGGFVLSPFAVVELPGRDAQRWVVEPFEFLRAALALPAIPVPDPTTETPRRLLMNHLDGDGIASRAEVPGAPFAAEVMLRDFIARYPVPHTVSVIQGETASTGVYAALSPALEEIARRIFALPQVEPATHSYSHPFFWRQAVAGETDRRYTLAVPGYAFDLDAELSGSAKYIDDRLLPPGGRRTGVFLWTGDCAPPPVAIARAWLSGLLNMNGGETTITRANPTLTAVAPMSIRKDGWLQVLAPNQNENVYTNLWAGPFWGFERVIETFQMTEQPRRLKPVNIYYHTYSASKQASIAALRKVYDWAMAQPLHPVRGSDWIRRIVDFEGFVVARDTLRPGRFKLVGDGDLGTVRLPAGLPGDVDLARSEGVAGWRSGPDGRWIHLAAPVAWLVASEAVGGVDPPFVLEGNGRVDRLRRTADGIEFRFTSRVTGELTLSHPPYCRMTVGDRSAEGKRMTGFDLLRSGHDVFRYTLPRDARSAGVVVSVGCRR